MLDKHIFERYYNKIIKTVKGYIFNNEDNIDLSTYMVPAPTEYIDFDDFELYKVNYEVVDNQRIHLEIIVIAYVIVRQYIRGETELDIKPTYVSVFAEVELDSGLQSFRMYNAEYKSDQYRKSQNIGLSKDWVP